MDEKDANIDLLFRNGLKDFESLPPSEVWDKIQPAIRQRQRPLILFRAAAAVTVLVSLGLLTYRWGSETSRLIDSQMLLAEEESFAPASTPVTTLALNTRPEIPKGESNDEDKKEIGRILISRVEVNSDMPGFFTPAPLMDNGTEAGELRNPDYSTGRVDYLPASIFENELTNLLQENNDRIPDKRWSVGALFSPTYYNRMSEGNNEALSEILVSDQAVLSYSGGLSFSYRVNRRLTLSSGLYYAAVGNQLQGISAYSGFSDHVATKGAGNFDVSTINGTIKTSNADVFLSDNISGDRIITRYTSDVFDPVKSNLEFIDDALRQSFSYIELPVMLRYKIIDKGIDLNLIGGLSSNLLVYNSVYAGEGETKYKVGDTQDLNNLTFSSLIGMGMEYSISGSLSLNLEPTLRYYLNPFSEIPGIRVHPYSFGIFSGLTYRF